MTILLRRALFISMVAILAGCFPPRGNAELPVVSPAITAAATARWSDADEGQLSAGRTTMQASCNRCHGLPDPAAYDAEELPSIVARMAKKAQLAEDQEQAVLRYLLAAHDATVVQ